MNTGMQTAGSMRLFRAFAGIGAVTIAAGAFLAPVRMSSNLLLVSYFLLGIGLAATFFVALEYATGAGWSVAFRRVPEAASSALPVGAAGLILFFILGCWLYPWTHEQPAGFKALWLDLPRSRTFRPIDGVICRVPPPGHRNPVPWEAVSGLTTGDLDRLARSVQRVRILATDRELAGAINAAWQQDRQGIQSALRAIAV